MNSLVSAVAVLRLCNLGVVDVLYTLFWLCDKCVQVFAIHCKPSKANTRLKTTTCETGPGTRRIYSLEICMWSLLILEIDDGWYFPNYIYDSSKCYLYIEFAKYLNLSWQGSNLHSSYNELLHYSRIKSVSSRIWTSDLLNLLQISLPLLYSSSLHFNLKFIYLK